MDVHCDEIDDEQSRFIETLAALAYRRGIGPWVTASHTTAMHSYNGAYASRLFRLLRMADINFVANPLVNIHLGRFDTYPKRRGITRVKEMLEANINVCFGHDDVFDPGIPWARQHVCRCCMGLHVCQSWASERNQRQSQTHRGHSARTLNVPGSLRHRGWQAANLLILPCGEWFRCGAPPGAGSLFHPPWQSHRRYSPGRDVPPSCECRTGGLSPLRVKPGRLIAGCPLLPTFCIMPT